MPTIFTARPIPLGPPELPKSLFLERGTPGRCGRRPASVGLRPPPLSSTPFVPHSWGKIGNAEGLRPSARPWGYAYHRSNVGWVKVHLRQAGPTTFDGNVPPEGACHAPLQHTTPNICGKKNGQPGRVGAGHPGLSSAISTLLARASWRAALCPQSRWDGSHPASSRH